MCMNVTYLNSDKHSNKTSKNFRMGPIPKVKDKDTIVIMKTIESFLLGINLFISCHKNTIHNTHVC